MTGCGRQAEESKGLPRSPQPSVSCTHTGETHWGETAISSFDLILEAKSVRNVLPVTVNTFILGVQEMK